jgi:hypothetical protein
MRYSSGVITVTATLDGLTLTVTQEYDAVSNTGHWQYVLYLGADIVKVQHSLGSPPQGQVDEAWALKRIKDCLRDKEQWNSY